MKKRKIPVYVQTNRSGSQSFVVPLGKSDGKRVRKAFKTKAEAQTAYELWQVQKKNQGQAAFTLALDKRIDAVKAIEILGTDISLIDAARYYRQHVLSYKTAPVISEIIERFVKDGIQAGDRPRTLTDKKGRGKMFAADFGTRRLSDLSLEELKDWLADDEWGALSRINYRRMISQIYNYAHKHQWVDSNLAKTN